MKVFNPLNCEHPNRKLVNRPDSQNRPNYRHQCVDCGAFPAPAISYEAASRIMPLKDIPLYDSALIEECQMRIANIQSGRVEYVLENFTPEYHAYIKSVEWKEKAKLVLKRANNTCEACGKNSATQVHHFNYENLGNEFLWDLAAVCKECHDRAHLWKQQDRSERADMLRQRIFRELSYSPLFQDWFENKFSELQYE